MIWNFGSDEQNSDPKFFVGVEYAIDKDSVEDAKALVDRVKNFTNLFVVDSLGITLDIKNLNEVCDYVYDAGLYFLVFFIAPHEGENHTIRYNYYPHIWILKAQEKYGDKFLGTYAYDEWGGNQLDRGVNQIVKAGDAENPAEAAEKYVEWVYGHTEYYTILQRYEDYTVLTADYGLYWFDYKAGYDAVLAEFGWNHSRQLHVALCRGAAKVQNREWGTIVTWTYNGTPYLESANELYDDLVLAYHNGAKYAVVFDYPETSFSAYGILTEEHFDALKDFWNYLNNNPRKHGTEKAKVAYVLPENYGFGFRNPEDTIWGLWSADEDERSEKIWGDVNQLIDEYGSSLDIVYSDPEFNGDLQRHYEQLFFWKSAGTVRFDSP